MASSRPAVPLRALAVACAAPLVVAGLAGCVTIQVTNPTTPAESVSEPKTTEATATPAEPAEPAETTEATTTPAEPAEPTEVSPESAGPTTTSVQASFTMPQVTGIVLQDAQDLLQSLGSYLLDQEDAMGRNRSQVLDDNWQVCTQEPAAGQTIPVETVVVLSSVKLDETCP